MLILVKLPSKLAWLPIIALSKLVFLMCECVCTKLFFMELFTIWHPSPKDTLGPTVALTKTTSLPI